MPHIQFSQALQFAKEPSSAALQAQLEEFFNKPDVQEKMIAVAKQAFPNPTDLLASPLSIGTRNAVLPLHDFLPSADSDGNPLNLCAAVLYALQETHANDRPAVFSLSASEGLKKVAGDMLSLIQSTPGENDLKTSILNHAAKAVTVNTGRH